METVKARKSLILFLILVILGSTPLIWLVIQSNLPAEDPRQLPYLVSLMWVPAIASIITRLVYKEGFSDISFKLGGKKGWLAIGIALVFPVLVGVIAYGGAWAAKLAEFVVPETGMFAGLNPPLLRFSLTILMAVTLYAIVGLISAAGEEIGWRGFMVPRLVQSGVKYPLIISGLIWGAWHIPGVLSGIYSSSPNRVLSSLFFMLFAVGLSILWGRLRLKTGSVWPAMLGHAAWNQAIPVFTRYFPEEVPGVWLNESGLLVVISIMLLIILFDRVIVPKVFKN
ncbi:abortive infection protein [Leptolinea sp. HRD-7]|nr:abortive infection protein [Leptolinea sp. HRD-7]